MTEQKIAPFLKQLRKTSGLSANEVVDTLKKYNIDISAKTLYGYESGVSMLNADVFVSLCRIYKCDNPMDIFGTPSIDQSEIFIIEKYRDLDDHGKEMVDFTLEKEWERSTAKTQPATNTIAFPEQKHLVVNAAHPDETATPEERQAGDAIMTDDSEWE